MTWWGGLQASRPQVGPSAGSQEEVLDLLPSCTQLPKGGKKGSVCPAAGGAITICGQFTDP